MRGAINVQGAMTLSKHLSYVWANIASPLVALLIDLV